MRIEQIGDWALEDRLAIGDRPLVVMFAKTGGPRNALFRTEFRNVAEAHPEARFYEVDLLENPSLRAKYKLSKPPMILIFVQGVEVARHVGSGIAPTLDRVLGPCHQDGDDRRAP